MTVLFTFETGKQKSMYAMHGGVMSIPLWG
nr:MAG TPA: hypothetical protein [Caudoviricetes sp.]